jgi:hypothetical protein
VLYKTLYAVGELKPLDMEVVNFHWGSIWNPTPNNPDVDLGEVLVTVELASLLVISISSFLIFV